ncbi:MAG: acylphosphatase [Euryarchaeota archaeon]|jgi:acylphosphatase|nr:acylphosphatase [Euryarchaeota archaeon]
MKTRVHVVISGRVQGVWYRASTKQKADELGLTGWVKNTVDGNVEAVFDGEKAVIDEMITWCWIGPPLARVSDVKIVPSHSDQKCTSFVVLYK